MDSEGDKFTFTLALPIEYRSTENAVGCSEDIETEINAYLTAFDLHVNAPSLNLPPTKVDAKYCPVTEASKLSHVIRHLCNPRRFIPDSFIYDHFTYDVHGFKFLEDYYECPSFLAWCAIEFTCSFVMENYPEPGNPDDPDDDTPLNLWGFDTEEYWDDGGILLQIEAMDVFSDALLCLAINVIAIMNLARPGCVRSRCAFVDRGFVSETISSTAPNIRAYRISELSRNLCASEGYEYFAGASPGSIAYNEIEPRLRPPIFEPLAPERLWTWATSMTGFSDGEYSITNVGRALNRYISLFQRRSVAEDILTTVAALETIFTIGRTKKQAQLIRNIPLLVPVDKLFPDKSFPTLIEHLYEQRSRFAHGDNNVRNPFIEDLYDREMRLAAMHAVVLLMESLRRLSSRQLTSYSPS